MNKQRWIVAVVGIAVLAAALWLARGRGGGGAGKRAADPPTGKSVTAPAVVTKKAAAEAPLRPAPAVSRDADPDGPLRLEGSVLDERDRPVAGAEVWLSSSPQRTTTTDTDGSFTFDKLLGRTYALGAREGDRVGGPVATKVTAQPEPVVIRLRTGTQVTVRVRGTGDQPLAGATVTLLEDTAPAATTDAAGLASFRGVGDGWIAVRATAAGYGPGSSTALIGKSQRTAELTIAMTAGAAVSGIVVDERGAGIAGARVWASDASSAWDASGGDRDPATTDAKGEFTLAALSAGSYRLAAIDETHAPAASAIVTVDGEHATTGVRLVMATAAVIAGVVVEADGRPAPYATVKVSSTEWANDMVNRQAVADDRGAFQLGALPRRTLKVRAEAEAASSPLVTVELAATAARKDLRLVLDQTASIAGVVVDKAGQPVAEASVTAVPDFLADDRGDFDFILASTTATTTDGGGRFVLRGLEAGGYRLAASRGGHGERTAWGVDSVAVRSGATDVRLILPAPGGVRGKIKTAGGDAPALAMISAGGVHRTTTHDGTFELSGLTPGKVDVRVSGPDFAERVQGGVVVADGEITDLGTIEVAAGRRASGRVADAKGAPIADAKVMIDKMIFGDGKSTAADLDDENNRAGLRTATTAADGTFTLRGIGRDGAVLVAEHASLGRSIALPVPPGTEDVTGLVVTLRGYGSLAGRVTRKGEPVAGAAISAAPVGASGQAVFVTTGADGRFILDKLPEGPTAVTAMKQVAMSTISAARTVTVVAGRPTDASIDMPAGDVALTVQIEPKAGDTVNAAWILLVHGAFVARDGQALMDAFLSVQGGAGGGAAGAEIWLGTPTFPTFRELVPARYTVCAMPLTGNILDPQFGERVNANLDKLDVVCKAVTVTAAPAEQTFKLVTPAMKPLPVPGAETP